MWAVNYLARNVTKWTKACDKRLLRLISYINCTSDLVLYAYIGDSIEECKLVLYSDASFAGDIMDSKSTTGGFLVLIGPNTFVPLGHLCKKQGAVSHSSTEAEVVALDACLRMDGIPALLLWDQVLQTCAPKATKADHSATRKGWYDAKFSLSVFDNNEDMVDVNAFVQNIDYVPSNIPLAVGPANLCLLEKITNQ